MAIDPLDPPDEAFFSPEDRRWESLARQPEKPEYAGMAGPLTCANCGEESTNPGQFVKDGRWVCTDACRKELCDKQSFDDLADSGGIVDAP